jgi:hypothetical protein
MSKQRGIAFLHIILLIFLVVLGFIGTSHYMKVSAKNAEIAAKQQAIVAAEQKRLADIESAKAQGKKSLEELKRLAKIYDEDWVPALQIASATGRIALSGPVQNLQAIYKKVKAEVVTGCAVAGKEGLVTNMYMIIEQFIAFMGSDPAEPMRSLIASRSYDEFLKSIETCKAIASGSPEPKESTK